MLPQLYKKVCVWGCGGRVEESCLNFMWKEKVRALKSANHLQQEVQNCTRTKLTLGATRTWKHGPLWSAGRLPVGTAETWWEADGDSENPGERESKGILFSNVTALWPCCGGGDLQEPRPHREWARGRSLQLKSTADWSCWTRDHHKGVWYSHRVINETPWW